MISATATPSLAPDPRVPGRDVLLDATAMSRRLAELLGTDGTAAVEGCARGRVKYKVGGSLRVVYELIVDGAPQVVASRTFPDGRSASVYERAREAARKTGPPTPPPTPLRAVAHDPALEAVFWTFPNDRKIAGLPALVSGAGAVSRLLGRPVARTVLAAYAPEKSATAACLDAATGRPVAYVKVFASAAELAASHHAHRAVAAALGDGDAALRVPAVLGLSEDDRMLAVEAVDGRRIDTLLGPERLDALRRLGAALATLHGLPAPDGVAPFARLDREHHARAAEVIGTARPDVAATAARLAHDLADGPGGGGERVCLHGDLHLKNGLLQGCRVALIDLDQVGVGPAAADLGSAIAALRYHGLVAGEVARAEREERALLDGYATLRDLPDAVALRWHVAAALLTERALRAVNRVRAEGLAHLGALLAEARDVLTAKAVR